MLLLNLSFFERFTPSLLTFILGAYFISRRETTARTLGGFFLFLSVFNTGYLLGFSGWHKFAPYGFHLACFITVALVMKVQFAYRMPRLIFRKEAAVVLVITTLVSIAAIADYAVEAEKAGYRFIYEQHTFASRYISGYVPLVSTIMFIWVAVVLIRQLNAAVPASGGAGPSRLAALCRHEGPEAAALRGFLLLVILELGINLLVLLGFLTSYVPKRLMNQVLNFGLLFVYFFYGILYVNHSRHSTTMMLRLVGIGFVTMLVVLGLLGGRSLQRLEESFDDLYLGRLPGIVSTVTTARPQDAKHLVPADIAYVASRPTGSLYSGDYDVIVPGVVGVSPAAFVYSDEEQRTYVLSTRAPQLQRERRLSEQEARQAAEVEISRKTPPLAERRFRTLQGVPFLHYDVLSNGRIYEIGFPYEAYRVPVHRAVLEHTVIVAIAAFGILIVFPLFFRASLVRPLGLLLDGVRKVNNGDLESHVPVQIEDEIGFLARSFNSMVASVRSAQVRLREYAETLELRVRERTAELQSAYNNLDALKRKQDGDYFLTSLLISPLAHNSVAGGSVQAEFFTRQKKQFDFKHWKSEIGGDICIGDRIALQGKDYTVILNADAMGKSIQGSGGVLVVGSLFQAILNRTRAGLVADYTPERWMQQAFREMDLVFKSFRASMLVSICLVLVDELTGVTYFISAEHPQPVLLRGARAEFLEYPHALNKLGTPDGESAALVALQTLEQGDILLLGSDGRDDILLERPGGAEMNENPFLFVETASELRGDLEAIARRLESFGEITDDLSLVRIQWEPPVPRPLRQELKRPVREAVQSEDWQAAADATDEFLRHYPEESAFLQTAARIYRKARRLNRAIDLLECLRIREPAPAPAVFLDLVKLYYKTGKSYRSLQILEEYLMTHPDDSVALEMRKRLVSTIDRLKQKL